MSVDLVEFNQFEEIEDDHHLEDFFPKVIPYHLQPLIEYRIKLVIKTDSLFLPVETQVVNTSCLMKGKSRKQNKHVPHTI